MSLNLGNIPMSQVIGPWSADPAADITINVFRMPAEGRVLGFYASNDANIASSTNTLAVSLVNRGTAGTANAATIATIAAATAWTADTPRTGALTAANQDVASGVWLGVVRDETGTGTQTRLIMQIDYMLASGATT